MALPLVDFKLYKVGRPHLGENKPSEVRAEATISLAGCRPEVAAEWNALRKHDVVFLLTLEATVEEGGAPSADAFTRLRPTPNSAPKPPTRSASTSSRTARSPASVVMRAARSRHSRPPVASSAAVRWAWSPPATRVSCSAWRACESRSRASRSRHWSQSPSSRCSH